MFERLRAILHEGEIDKRVQFMIEGLFAIRKAGFAKSGFPSIQPDLDLVQEEDQITHEITLDEDLDPEMHLDVFKSDDLYEQHEKEYEAIKQEILGMMGLSVYNVSLSSILIPPADPIMRQLTMDNSQVAY